MKNKTQAYAYYAKGLVGHKAQMDMILYEIRQNRKDILELKTFMNKSKGTMAVIMFLAGIFGIALWGWNYFR